VILAALAVAVYLGVVVAAALRAPSVAPLVGCIGGLGALILLWVLLRREQELLPWPLLLAGIGYAVALAVRGGRVDGGAALVGAGLLLCGELTTWSIDEHWAIRAERIVVLRRAAAIAALVVAGLGAGGLVIALAAAPVGGGLAWTVLGAAAVVAVIGITVRLARS
jgi:hypothetical protein